MLTPAQTLIMKHLTIAIIAAELSALSPPYRNGSSHMLAPGKHRDHVVVDVPLRNHHHRPHLYGINALSQDMPDITPVIRPVHEAASGRYGGSWNDHGLSPKPPTRPRGTIQKVEKKEKEKEDDGPFNPSGVYGTGSSTTGPDGPGNLFQGDTEDPIRTQLGNELIFPQFHASMLLAMKHPASGKAATMTEDSLRKPTPDGAMETASHAQATGRAPSAASSNVLNMSTTMTEVASLLLMASLLLQVVPTSLDWALRRSQTTLQNSQRLFQVSDRPCQISRAHLRFSSGSSNGLEPNQGDAGKRKGRERKESAGIPWLDGMLELAQPALLRNCPGPSGLMLASIMTC